MGRRFFSTLSAGLFTACATQLPEPSFRSAGEYTHAIGTGDLTKPQRAHAPVAHGSGLLRITYSDGKIDSVEIYRSTGNTFLDNSSVAWIRAHWKVRPGTTGTALIPLSWQRH